MLTTLPRRAYGALWHTHGPFATVPVVTSPTPQSERRRATRVAASFPIKLSSDAVAEPAVLRDLSELGMACTAPEPVDEMTMVGIDFSLPGATDRHHVKGAVVRSEPMPDQPNKWDIAVYFTDVTPVTRAALKNYVGRHA